MSVFIAGGTGFIGRRLTRSLVAQGETVTVMDIAPQDGDFDDLGDKVKIVRGDISQFDDVIDKMAAAEADRVINLAYYIGNHHPPHVAMKLNVIGMDNFFEAARLTGAKRVVYASSLAVYGFQRHYGERRLMKRTSNTATINMPCIKYLMNGRRRTIGTNSVFRLPAFGQRTSLGQIKSLDRSTTFNAWYVRRVAKSRSLLLLTTRDCQYTSMILRKSFSAC